MANAEQLALLKAGVRGWNRWREKEPDREIDLTGTRFSGAVLRGVNLSEAHLSGAYFIGTNLIRANLSGVDLRRVILFKADLGAANLSGADLRRVHLGGVNLSGADLRGADLREARLWEANLSGANLSDADLRGASLTNSVFVRTRVDNAKISGSNVYGIGVWDLKGEFKEQKDLIITPEKEPPITVDNIKVAQFVYLILNNREIRDVINTLTSKTVLILGRFAIPERIKILNVLRNKLREYDLLPIVFDFDRPSDKDFTETIKTLAGICYFVIADVTNPKSAPLELQATVPDYQIPFVPIIQKGEDPFSMLADLQKRDWVLPVVTYESGDYLIRILKKGIIDRAIEKHNELRVRKAIDKPLVISGDEFLDDDNDKL
jgi:hypothetical protein